MERYTGSVVVFDAEKDGDIVFERVLTEDEIVAEVLAVTIANVSTVIEEKPKKEKAEKKRGSRTFPTKTCCGSKGPRCKSGCVNAKSRPMVTEEVVEEEDVRPLTFYEFGMAKRYQSQNATARAVADELEVSVSEITKAFNSEDFDVYKETR